MFPVREAKEGAPTRFVCHDGVQPELVNTVAGSIAVALHNTIQTKENLFRLPRVSRTALANRRGLEASKRISGP